MPTINGTPGNDMLTGTNEPDVINGLAGDDQLSGLDGNDELDGGEGADTMNGGAGDDLFLIDNASDLIIESGSGGANDQLITSVNYTLHAGARVETLRAAEGTAPLFIRGNELAQTIHGNAGNNLLIGGGGIRFEGIFAIGDTFIGGAGNDTYVVTQAFDRIVEAAGEGDDVVLVAALEYILRPGVSVETMVAAEGTEPITMYGNELAQSIYGNAGNNIILSQGGADYLVGGAGHDSYYVSALATIAENPGEGDDLVRTTNASFTLPANVEDLEASWSDFRGTTDPLSLTGNELDNEIVGNLGNNILRGGGGNDTLYGAHDLAPQGNEAPDGNDILNGGAGADHMDGRQGNDLYIVDNAGDTVVERTGDGDDIVSTFVSYALPEGFGGFIETLAAQDSAGAIALQGNGNSQSIYGNAANNILISNGGADYLVGGGGNDTYYLNGMFNSEERIAESAGGGSDVVYVGHDYTLNAGAEVEILSAAAQTATTALNLTGNDRANHVIGNDGANTLEGGLGRDTFSGRAGADMFVFAALGEDNADQIYDFAPGPDKIGLRGAHFPGIPEGTLSASAFRAGTSAQDADDRIIYDSATGRLWFDPDGSGAAQQTIFGYVSQNTALTASDFQLLGTISQAARKSDASAITASTVAASAAGLAAMVPAHTKLGADAESSHLSLLGDNTAHHGEAHAPTVIGDGHELQVSALIPAVSRASADHESRLSALHDSATEAAPAPIDVVPASIPEALVAATDAPVHANIPVAAPTVAMPSAEMLAALAAADGSGDTTMQEQVSQVVADALASTFSGGIDHLLDALPGASVGNGALAATEPGTNVSSGLDALHGHAFGPVEPLQIAFAMEDPVVHPDFLSTA